MAEHLCQCIFTGDMALMRRYIKAGVDINMGDYDQRTPLHIAAAEINLPAVIQLISVACMQCCLCSCLPYCHTDCEQLTLLHIAAAEINLPAVPPLLPSSAHGVVAKHCNEYCHNHHTSDAVQRTLLHVAAAEICLPAESVA